VEVLGDGSGKWSALGMGLGIGATSRAGGARGVEEQEKLRRVYKYKIAIMQSCIMGIECDYLGGNGEREKGGNRWLEG